MRPFTDPRLESIAVYFETLTPASLSELQRLYHPQAQFKDPFNDVRGLPAIERIFAHMFTQVQRPRFHIVSGLVQDPIAWMEWDFLFEQRNATIVIRGVSKLDFDSDGKIKQHRDFWDTGEELYAKLPLIGWVIQGLRKKLSAS